MDSDKTGNDDEAILANLAALPINIKEIVFPVSIYEAEMRHQAFGQLSSAYVHVVDQASGLEIGRYDLSKAAATETAVISGRLHRTRSGWAFKVGGHGYA